MVDLANWKVVDDLYIDKLKSVSVDLSMLSNVVKNDFIKNTAHDELVKKITIDKTIDTSDFVK